jgi:hypothetical protein
MSVECSFAMTSTEEQEAAEEEEEEKEEGEEAEEEIPSVERLFTTAPLPGRSRGIPAA